MTRARAVRVCAVNERSSMKYRKRLSRKGSKRLFRKTAVKTHKANIIRPMRGGERL